jgi:hypothetical protein
MPIAIKNRLKIGMEIYGSFSIYHNQILNK